MEKEKVTRDALREMKVGESKTFHLENYAEAESGKSVAHAFAKVVGCKVTTSTKKMEDGWTITVTKEELD